MNKAAKFIMGTKHVSVHENLYEKNTVFLLKGRLLWTHALIKWMQDWLQKCQVKYEPPYNIIAALHTKLSPQGVPSLTKPISGFPDESIVPLVALEVACQQRQCKVY